MTKRSNILLVGLVAGLAIVAALAGPARAELIPPAATDMLAWYKADTGVTLSTTINPKYKVTNWADSSGHTYNLAPNGVNNQDATVASVTFGPYASGPMTTIDFAGSTHKLVNSATVGDPTALPAGSTVGTVLVMLKPSSTTPNAFDSTSNFQTLLTFSNTNAQYKCILFGNGTNYDLPPNNNEYLMVRSGASKTTSGVMGSGSIPYVNTIMATRFNSATSQWNIYLGTGAEPNRLDNGYGGTPQTLISPDVISIGYPSGSPNPMWKGQIAEILIYKTALSDADFYAAQAYLSKKYGYTSLSSLVASPTTGEPISLGSNIAPSGVVNITNAVSLTNSDTGVPGTPGNSTLHITGVQLTGTNSSLFSYALATGGTTSLGVGAMAQYNLGFAGAPRGSYSATVTFTTDADNGPKTSTYDLSAVVTASVLTASPTTGPFNFGTTLAPSAAVTLTDAVTLTNTGDAGTTLNVIKYEITGANAGLFSAALTTSTTSLSQNDFAKYDINFLGAPAAGTYTASILFTTDAQDGAQTVSYDLSATVVMNDIPGDINRDHIVDQADYTVWYNHYGQTPATWSDGDVTGDNIVDQADYTVWYNHYGQTGGNVPEPMTMSVLALGGIALLRRRRAA